jgi:DNA-binding NtrC family response regulator
LLDLTMPRQGGLEVFRDMHRLRPDVPVILMSGFSPEEVKAHCAGLDFAGFLEKPFHLDRLLAVLQAGLEAGATANSS